MVTDPRNTIYTDPSKVVAIGYRGGCHNMKSTGSLETSPQRTRVRYPAGASPAGKAFEARNAKSIFLVNIDLMLTVDNSRGGKIEPMKASLINARRINPGPINSTPINLRPIIFKAANGLAAN